MNLTQFIVSEENMSDDVFSFCINCDYIFKEECDYMFDENVHDALTEYGCMLYDILINIYGVSLVTFNRHLDLTKISIKINLALISSIFIRKCIGILFHFGYEQLKLHLAYIRNLRVYNEPSMIVYEPLFRNMRKYSFLKMMMKNKNDMSIWTISDIFEYAEYILKNNELVDYSYLSRYGKLFFNHFVDFIITHSYFQNIFSSIVIYNYSIDITLRENDDADMFFNEYDESLNRVFDFGVICRE